MAITLPLANVDLPDGFAPGHDLTLRDGERGYVRALQGPAGSLPIILLPGWGATAAVIWGWAMAPLSATHDTYALEFRGHGRAPRSEEPFSLQQSADDVVSLLDELSYDKAIIVGYSMGGAVGQLVARDHPDRVAGLVTCLSAARFPTSVRMLPLVKLAGQVMQALPGRGHRSLLPLAHTGIYAAWPFADEVGRNDPRLMLQAATELSEFDSREWVGRLTVPTACLVVHGRDKMVPVPLQQELATLMKAPTFAVNTSVGHRACFDRDAIVPPLLDACLNVTARAEQLERRNDWALTG